MSWNFLQWFSTARYGVFEIFMKLLQPIQIMYDFEIRQIFSPLIMPRITSKITSDIRKCERVFQGLSQSLNTKINNSKRKKEMQVFCISIYYKELHLILLHNSITILSTFLLNGTSLRSPLVGGGVQIVEWPFWYFSC